MQKKRKNGRVYVILLAFCFVCLLRLGEHYIHGDNIVTTKELIVSGNREKLLKPGFYIESNYGTQEYKNAVYVIDGANAKLQNGEYQRTYDSFFNTSAYDRLKKFGKTEDYGQLMYHENNSELELFIFDNWYIKEEFYRIFVIRDDELNEILVPHAEFEGMAPFSLGEEKLYLHRSFEQVSVIVSVDLETGDYEECAEVFWDTQRVFNSSNGTRYFPEKTQLVSIIVSEDKPTLNNDFWKGISIYDFAQNEYKFIETENLYLTVLMDENRQYYFVDSCMDGGEIRLVRYSEQLEYVDEQSICFPPQMSIDFDSWDGHTNQFSIILYEGNLYCFIPQSPNARVGYYCVFDLNTGSCVQLNQVSIGEKKKSEQYRFVHWKAYLPNKVEVEIEPYITY